MRGAGPRTGAGVAALRAAVRSTSCSGTSASPGVQDASRRARPWDQVPGPRSLPLIGPLLNFLPGGIFYKLEPSEVFWKFSNVYGPIVKINGFLGAPTVVLVFEPESAAQVLRSENTMPVRPGFLTLEYYRKHYKTGKNRTPSLITDHGDEWKQFRSKVNPVLLQPKTIKLYSSVIDQVATDMIERMKFLRNDKNMIESKFDVEMNLWALESIAVVALGGRLNCFDPNLAEDSPARRLIRNVHELFKIADELDYKPGLWHYYSTKAFKRAMKLFEEQESLAKHFVNKAKLEIASNPKTSNEEKGVLEKLLEIDEKIATVMASDMLFAGVDTAANTMIATLYLLAVNPEKQTKLREEIHAKENKSYLRACIKESMRMMPVVGANIRQTSKDYNLLGYHIPKGTNIAFAHWYMSNDESNFPQPQQYVPERWLADREDPLHHGRGHPFAFNPFGFGVRSCIGRRIAELEVETFLSRVVQSFEVKWFGGPPTVTTTSLNYVTGPFNFIFEDVEH